MAVNTIDSIHVDNCLMNLKMNNNVSKLYRLRYHLAIEGCTDSQLSLAKSFLQEATDSDAERKENSELAVRWLLLASSEGNAEAHIMLESCYKMGVGITVHTRSDVEACLNSTSTEKLAHRVGNSLFRLIAYDAREPIPIVYFQHRIYQYLNNIDISVGCKIVLPQNNSNLDLTVKDVVTAVHQVMIGENPSISLNNICSLQFHSQTESKLGRVYNVCVNGINNYSALYHHFICELSKLDIPFALTLVGFILFVIERLLSFGLHVSQYKDIVLVSELFVVYIFLSIMIVSSSRIIKHERERENVNQWLNVIIKLDPKLQETKPISKNISLVICAFMLLFSLFVLEAVYSDIYLGVFHRLFFVSCFFIRPNWNRSNWAVNIFLILNLLLALTKVSEKQSTSISAACLVDLSMPYHYLVEGFPATAISICAISVYIYVLNYCKFSSSLGCLVSSVWLHFAFKNMSISNLNIVYGFSFWLFVILINRKVGLYTALSIACIVDQVFCGRYLLVAIICLSIFLLFTKISSYFLTFLSSHGIFKIYMCVLLILFLVFFGCFMFNTEKKETLTWPEYARHCHRPAWVDSNMAKTQILCDRFRGHPMIFQGTVSHVRLLRSFSWYVPDLVKRFCTLNEIHIFEPNLYEIAVQIKGTFRTEAELAIRVTNVCREFVLELLEGDVLNIVGILELNIGTTKPVLFLENADCISSFTNCRIDYFSWITYLKPRILKSIGILLYPWAKQIV